MSRERKRDTPEWQWEQALIDAYYDYRHHELLDPLYDEFQRWKAGDVPHGDLLQAIHEVHQENRRLWSLFGEKRDVLVLYDQWYTPFFEEWVKQNPPPPGIRLVPRPVTGEPEPEETRDADTAPALEAP